MKSLCQTVNLGLCGPWWFGALGSYPFSLVGNLALDMWLHVLNTWVYGVKLSIIGILLDYMSGKTMGQSQRHWGSTWNVWWRLTSRSLSAHNSVELFLHSKESREMQSPSGASSEPQLLMRLLNLTSAWLGSNLEKLLVEKAFYQAWLAQGTPDSAEKKATGRLEKLQHREGLLVCLTEVPLFSNCF